MPMLLRLILMGALLYPLTVSYGIIGASVAVTLPMVPQFLAGIVLSQRYIGVPIATVLRPFTIAIRQRIVLAAVLLGAKMFVSSSPVISLVVIIAVGGLVCLALNAQEVPAVWRSRSLCAAFAREGQ